MKEKTIRVLKVAPNEAPQVVTLDNTLTALQEAVSIGAEHRGLIELVNLGDGCLILCNEESKLIGLAPNRRLGRDILCGVFYVVGRGKAGELASLPDSAMSLYAARFREPEKISESEVVKTIVAKFFAC